MKKAIQTSRTADKEFIAPYLCGVMLLKTKDGDFFAGVIRRVSCDAYPDDRKKIKMIEVTFSHLAQVYSAENWPNDLRVIRGSVRTEYLLTFELERKIVKIERHDTELMIIKLASEEIYFYPSGEKVQEVRALFERS